eukprot:jgi/Undpi1/7656/HiC_scaffold_23.g10129.m1
MLVEPPATVDDVSCEREHSTDASLQGGAEILSFCVKAVDLTVNSGNTDATLTAAVIACDEWTTFEIQNNRLKLVAQDGGSFADDQVYAFENVRFLVTSGVLRADVAVSFTTGADDIRPEVDGGVLKVEEGGYARFREDVSMSDVNLLSYVDEGSDISSDRWFGGCIHNQGTIRFEDFFSASDCATVGGGESAPGNGGGIFNGETGSIVFKGEMEMTDCGTFDNEGNLGGAIYNEGKITMFDTSTFVDNRGAGGGAIYNSGIIKFLKDAFATFIGNRTYDGGDSGGQAQNLCVQIDRPAALRPTLFRGKTNTTLKVSNFGSINFNGGVIFEDGFTEAGGGAISNSDTVIIKQSAVFRNNVASEDGGAITSPSYATFDLPDDTVFDGNYVRYDPYGNAFAAVPAAQVNRHTVGDLEVVIAKEGEQFREKFQNVHITCSKLEVPGSQDLVMMLAEWGNVWITAVTEVTDVTVSANAWDTRTAGYGCAPVGCVPANVLNASIADESRWSCRSSSLGVDTCELTFVFSEPTDIFEVRMAMWKGNQRNRTVSFWVDGVLTTTVETSADTLEYEAYPLSANQASTIVLQDAGGDPLAWLSITGVQLMTDYDADVSSPGVVPTSGDYVGCYNDLVGDRILTTVFTDDALTPAICEAACAESSKYYYGLQQGNE